MLGHWRVVLRQAEESARAGRYDEALALANRPDVADHRQALLLRNRLAVELVGRAERRAKADDVKGAVVDLDLAEQFGAAPDVLAAARLAVADRVADEVRGLLDAGDPARTLERIDELARHQVSGPVLRRTREAAEAWKSALDEARRGEFGLAQEHLDRSERLAGESARPAIAAARRDLEARQKAVYPRVEVLYAALGKGAWPEILGAAEAVLDLAAEHPAAKQARSRAWQQIAAISPSAAPPQRIDPAAPMDMAGGIVFLDEPKVGYRRPAPIVPAREALIPEPQAVAAVAWANSPRPQRVEAASCPICRGPMAVRQGLQGSFLGCRAYPRCRGTAPLARATADRDAILVINDEPAAESRPSPPPAPAPNTGPGGRFLLWADIVGAYLVCLDNEVTIGRAGPESSADIPVLGDLSRRHATLIRDGDSYLLRAYQTTYVNNRKVEVATLHDGDVLRLGPSVEMEFRQPSPVSSTARLAIRSRHRLPMAVDGIILMAETCIMGPSSQAHLPATDLAAPVVLYRQGAGIWCRAAGQFDIDGRTVTARGAVKLDSQVQGDGFSFSLEPLGRGPSGATA